MKRFFLIIPGVCTLLVVGAFKTFKKGETPKIYAVVVGISRYNDKGINPLKFAHKDAESYADFLKSSKGGSVSPDNIVLLTNEMATTDGITEALRNMLNNATEEDAVIFFYAGHGLLDPKIQTDLYFATYDTKEKNYTGTALEKGKVEKEFSNCRAKLKLFIADACHSGGSGIYLGTRDDGAEAVNSLSKQIGDIKEPNWAVLTAASRSEKSQENTKWGGGHGVFTYFLIQGLDGAADKTEKQNPKAKGNGDGIVTVREIYDYLNNIIPSETNNNQHPDKVAHDEDIFPLSANNSGKLLVQIQKFSAAKKADESKPGDTAVKEMDKNICTDNYYCYGEYCFENDYGEDLLLTIIKGGRFNNYRVNMLLAAGQTVCTERLKIGSYSNMTYNPASADGKFYFRTIDETKPIRFGTRTFTVEACKSKTEVLTKKNLYLSTTGEAR